MILKRILIIITCLVLLPILFLLFYSYISSLQYKESPPPKITADSIKSLVISLIQNEELFVGYADVKYINLDRNLDLTEAEITMRNNAIADDSINARESKMLAQKRGQTWTIVEYKSHWKCRGLLFFNFWTTNACS